MYVFRGQNSNAKFMNIHSFIRLFVRLFTPLFFRLYVIYVVHASSHVL